MAINDPKVIKKWPTYYNPYTFKEFFVFLNIYVVGQGDQQNDKVGEKALTPPPSFGQESRSPPHLFAPRGSPAGCVLRLPISSKVLGHYGVINNLIIW